MANVDATIMPISSREEAEGYLRPYLGQEGTFILRHSAGSHKGLAVCNSTNGVTHYKIDVFFPSGKYGIQDGKRYETLEEFVRHYMAKKDGLCSRLTQNVNSLADDGGGGAAGGAPGAAGGGDADLAPQTISFQDLEVAEELGSGEFGVVYRGQWKRRSQIIPVAVKKLKDASPEQVREFNIELETMSALNHKHVVKMHGTCPYRGEVMLITELVSNGELKKFLRNGDIEIDLDAKVLMITQIAQGMEYLASKAVVHRDLAARNVLVESIDLVKITDFGMSRILRSESDYYIPAQPGKWPMKWYALECLDDSKFSELSDVWSFGVTAWEVLTRGEMPYKGMSAAVIVHYIREGTRLPQPEDCPEELWDLLWSCWDAERTKRPNFAKIVTTLTGRPTEGLSRGKSVRTKKTIMRDQQLYQQADTEETAHFREDEREAFAHALGAAKIEMTAGYLTYALIGQTTKELGEGALGKVFLAEQPRIPGVAAPIAARHIEHTMGFFNVGLFCEEASKLTILDNPCIVKFMGYSTNNGALVLLTEYMCCGPINKVLKRRRTSTNDKLKYCTQVAEGMVYLASNSVVHRSLSAGHVLVSADCATCKVGSFGMLRALQLGPEYYRRDLGGRWPMKWMAPECLTTQEFSTASDVWAFGLTAWEILMDGTEPFRKMAGTEIAECILHTDMPQLSAELSSDSMAWIPNVLSKCWMLSPSERPSFDELLDTFKSHVAPVPRPRRGMQSTSPPS